MIDNLKRKHKMETIVLSYLNDEVKFNQAKEQLTQIGFTELEAKFELRFWEKQVQS